MSQQCFLGLGPDGFHRPAYTDWGEPRKPRVAICARGLSRSGRDFLPRALSPATRSD